jgi:hypothetical protein
MTMTLRTAPPGGGKSYTSVNLIVEAILAGKCVAGNVELVGDWPQRIARRHWPFWIRRFARKRFLDHARDRYHFSEDLEELFNIRLDGKGESRGLMVLDEAHNWMNARSWSKGDRAEIVRFFSQHRKFGWDVELIAQDAEMIDKQVRVLAEYIAYGRNLKKAKWGGVRLFPFNLFLVVVCWHASRRVVVERKLYRLRRWVANLYDHEATFGGLVGDAGSSAIHMPSPPSQRGQADPRVDGRTRLGAAGRPHAQAPAGPETPGEGHREVAEGEEEGEPDTWAQDGDRYRHV